MSKELLNAAVSQANKSSKSDKCVSRPPAAYPDPTPEDLASPEFKAVWKAIKGWDIGVPEWYDGYTGTMGNHVMAILNALKKAR